MTVTDEPGIYLAGQFGVRIENVLLVTPAEQQACGRFMGFEVLTLCPYDLPPLTAACCGLTRCAGLTITTPWCAPACCRCSRRINARQC